MPYGNSSPVSSSTSTAGPRTTIEELQRGNIDKSMSEVNELLNGAHQRLDTLIQKVDPVLKLAPPNSVATTDRGSGSAPTPMLSPCAETVRGQIASLHELLAKINNAVDRVDL